jgi:exosome complex component RRP42
MATKAALYNTRIPKTQIQDLGDGEFEFEVLDDVEDAERLDGIENIPIGVTLNKVKQTPCNYGPLNDKH